MVELNNKAANIRNLDYLNSDLIRILSIYEKHEQQDTMSGKKFNVFHIIRKGTEEVGLHSAFLGELLNPIGRHKSNNLFLKAFINSIVNPSAKSLKRTIFNPDSDYSISIEKTFQDGRIDIVIENSDSCIVIENKIDAGDQNEQLGRYYQYAKNRKNHIILYLTKFGKEASNQTKLYHGKEVDENAFAEISYRDDISNWLNKCALLAIDKPYIRENVLQYRDLVKELTNSMGDIMREEVKDYIQTKMNKEGLRFIYETISVLNSLRKDKISEYHEHIKSSPVLKTKIISDSINNNYNEEAFKTQKWLTPTYIKFHIDDDTHIIHQVWLQSSYSGDWLQLNTKNNRLKEKINNGDMSNIIIIDNSGRFIINHDNIDFFNDYNWLDNDYLRIKANDICKVIEDVARTINNHLDITT